MPVTSVDDRNGLPGWLVGDLYGIPIRKFECPRRGGADYYLASKTGLGVLHSVEGSNMSGALAKLKKDGSGPTFVPGDNEIVQTRPIYAQTSTLRSNKPHAPNSQTLIQIEMLYSIPHDSKGVPVLHLPPEKVLKPTVAILAYCTTLGIPLEKPYPWPDDGSDIQEALRKRIAGYWAGKNIRRVQAAAGLWPHPGWWQHLEVPHQQPTWHHDAGALNRTEMFRMAQELLDGEDKPAIYTVKAGDGLIAIARSLKVDLGAFLNVNGITLGSAIHPGQGLLIP